MKGIAGRASGQRRGSRLRRDGCIVAVLLCLATFAAACGGSQGSASGPPRSPLAFAQCMRAHGVPNFPDPNNNGRFNLAGIDTASPQVVRASEACGGQIASTSSGQESQGIAQRLKFSRCMRKHGVTNFPDPPPPSAKGANSVHVQGSSGEAPVFQRALTTCRPLLSGGSSSGASTP